MLDSDQQVSFSKGVSVGSGNPKIGYGYLCGSKLTITLSTEVMLAISASRMRVDRWPSLIRGSFPILIRRQIVRVLVHRISAASRGVTNCGRSRVGGWGTGSRPSQARCMACFWAPEILVSVSRMAVMALYVAGFIGLHLDLSSTTQGISKFRQNLQNVQNGGAARVSAIQIIL